MGFYNWKASFRFTPANGPVETLVLDSTTLTDLGHPNELTPHYELELERRQNVNEELVPLIHGWRTEVEIGLTLGTLADVDNVLTLLNRLTDPRYLAEMALNADAASPDYYEVTLRRHRGPRTLRGKFHSGARFELQLRFVELRDQLPEALVVSGGASQTI